MCGHTKEQPQQIPTTIDNNSSTTTNIDRIIGLNTQNLMSSPERDIDENNCATNYIISNTNNKRNSTHHRYQLGNSDNTTNNCDSLQERRLRQLRRQADWHWLNACIGMYFKCNYLL